MKILYVTPYVPSCIRTRPYNLIRALVGMGHRITLLTAAGTSLEEQEQTDELREWGVRVETFPISLARSLSNCLLALPTREPLQAVYSYHPAMERRLSKMMRERAFDVVHIEHLRASRLARIVGDAPVVYDSVDCISLLFEQAVQGSSQLRSRLMTALDLSRTRRYEAQLLTRYDQVVITSQRDKDAMKALARRYLPAEAERAPITVVTNGVDLEYFHPPENQNPNPQARNSTIVFTGKMSYHANIAAAIYFAEKILPRIWIQNPKVRFQIVGKDPPDVIQYLASNERIEVTGYVDDLRPYLAQATVAVCPALYAVGIQNKVLEAMAMATPVVSTPAGCAALAVEEGQEILSAEQEEDMALAVLKVLSEPDLARRLSKAGRKYVETHHSWEGRAGRLLEIYQQACCNSRIEAA